MAGIMQMLMGSSAGYVFTDTISGTVTNYNLRTAALAAGWDGATPLRATVTVTSTGIVGSSSTSGYAFDTGVGFPAGTELNLVNQGYIVGAGGAGGWGEGASLSTNGAAGGPALRAQAAICITNGGTIGGGGGGGDTGPAASGGSGTGEDPSWFSPGPGGGGGAGFIAGAGGSGGVYAATVAPAGSTGTLTAGGAGGPSIGFGAGGYGGALGSAGQEIANTARYPGAGGAAVVGNANITWVSVGTRLGSLT